MKHGLPTIASWFAAIWPPTLTRRNSALSGELAATEARLKASEKDAAECKARILELLGQNKLYAESLRIANLKLGDSARKTPNY